MDIVASEVISGIRSSNALLDHPGTIGCLPNLLELIVSLLSHDKASNHGLADW